MLMQEFYAFTQRLKSLKRIPHPKALSACIYKKDLLNIVDTLLKNVSMQKQCMGLMPNSAVRFYKETYNLSRTICVLRDAQGKFECILETKSKTNKNTKQKIEVAEGGFKKGKPAWRLDGKNGAEPYFSLLLPLEANDVKDKKAVENLENLKAEVNLPWELAKDSGMQRNRLGAVYENKKGALVASVYSKQRTPLNKALKADFPMTLAERHEIAISLLKTTAYLHEKNLTFQDLKPNNILIYRNKDQKLKVKLTDPGQVSTLSKPEISVATIGYESPEVALAHSVKSEYHDYFYNKYKKYGNSLGKQCSLELEKELTQNKGKPFVDALKQQYLQADPSNDVWALGTTLYKLFRGHKPTYLPTDKYFSGFFAPREHRFTAKQALDCWLELGAIAPRTKLQPT